MPRRAHQFFARFKCVNPWIYFYYTLFFYSLFSYLFVTEAAATGDCRGAPVCLLGRRCLDPSLSSFFSNLNIWLGSAHVSCWSISSAAGGPRRFFFSLSIFLSHSLFFLSLSQKYQLCKRSRVTAAAGKACATPSLQSLPLLSAAVKEGKRGRRFSRLNTE